MNGLTEDNMKGNGKTTKCTVKVSSRGEMEGDMRVITSMIKKKVLECLNGLMVENTSANGKMENKTDRELL